MIGRDRVLGLCIEGVADRFDLSKRVQTIGLGELFKDRRTLLRACSCREDQQHAEGQKADHMGSAQNCQERSLTSGVNGSALLRLGMPRISHDHTTARYSLSCLFALYSQSPSQ